MGGRASRVTGERGRQPQATLPCTRAERDKTFVCADKNASTYFWSHMTWIFVHSALTHINKHTHTLTQSGEDIKKEISLAFELAHGSGKWRNLNFDAGNGNQTKKKKAPIQCILFMGWGKWPDCHVKWERGEAIRKRCSKRDFSLRKLELRKSSREKMNKLPIVEHLNIEKIRVDLTFIKCSLIFLIFKENI